MWHVTCDMRNVTCDTWHNYKYSLLTIPMKTKVVQHVPRINISIWHMTCDMRNVTCDMWHVTCDMWHHYKYSLLNLPMKTKVVQQVPRFNITCHHKYSLLSIDSWRVARPAPTNARGRMSQCSAWRDDCGQEANHFTLPWRRNHQRREGARRWLFLCAKVLKLQQTAFYRL